MAHDAVVTSLEHELCAVRELLVELVDAWGRDVGCVGSEGPVDIHAVYPSGRHLPSKVRCFIDFFAEQYKQCEMIC